MGMSQEPVYARIHRNSAVPKVAPQTLCEPAQAKCHMDMSQEQSHARTLEEKCRMEHPDQAGIADQSPASTPTVRIPQCEAGADWNSKEANDPRVIKDCMHGPGKN